ncbi:MAG: SprT-like domain-containing protein, partial [Longimicrobiales bacterium]
HWRRRRRQDRLAARTARQRLVVELGDAACEGTDAQRAYLSRVYRQLNHSRFGGRLPRELPIRLSRRMRRRFGHVKYGYGPQHRRVVHEIALNLDLMLAGNERHLFDTMLHEMAHVEAWLDHGDGGHGVAWREIAERVDCEARACSWSRIRTRGRRDAEVTRVPRMVDLAS